MPRVHVSIRELFCGLPEFFSRKILSSAGQEFKRHIEKSAFVVRISKELAEGLIKARNIGFLDVVLGKRGFKRDVRPR